MPARPSPREMDHEEIFHLFSTTTTSTSRTTLCEQPVSGENSPMLNSSTSDTGQWALLLLSELLQLLSKRLAALRAHADANRAPSRSGRQKRPIGHCSGGLVPGRASVPEWQGHRSSSSCLPVTCACANEPPSSDSEWLIYILYTLVGAVGVAKSPLETQKVFHVSASTMRPLLER